MESDGFFVLTSIVLYCGLFKKIHFFITIIKIIKHLFILKMYILLPIIRVILCVKNK